MADVCLAWRAQAACHAPLSSARPQKYATHGAHSPAALDLALRAAGLGGQPPALAAAARAGGLHADALGLGGLGGAAATGGECVALVELNCRQTDMQSDDQPRGADHCVDFHQRILGASRAARRAPPRRRAQAPRAAPPALPPCVRGTLGAICVALRAPACRRVRARVRAR
jgi:hypothetical protein